MKKLLSSLLLISMLSPAFADISTDKDDYDNGDDVSINISVGQREIGDAYIAIKLPGSEIFNFIGQGNVFSTTPLIYKRANSSNIGLPALNTLGAPAGTYDIYFVTTKAGTDVLNFTNWVAPLQIKQITIGSVNSNPSVFTPPTTTSAATPGTTQTTIANPAYNRGVSSYSANCAMCHGATPSTNKIEKGVNASVIRTAISSNKGGMGFLTNSDADLEDIDAFLRGNKTITQPTTVATPVPVVYTPVATPVPVVYTPVATPVPTTTNTASGEITYASKCASCHGAYPSNIRSKSASATSSAIRSVGSMHHLSTLSTADMQAIADYLNTNTSTTNQPTTTSTASTGQGLYTQECASCHGSGISDGRSASKIQRAIQRNKGGMGYLTYLTSTELQLIASYLSTVPGGDDDDDDGRYNINNSDDKIEYDFEWY